MNFQGDFDDSDFPDSEPLFTSKETSVDSARSHLKEKPRGLVSDVRDEESGNVSQVLDEPEIDPAFLRDNRYRVNSAQSKDRFGIFVVAGIALGALNLLGIFWIFLKVDAIQKKDSSVAVQLSTGKTILAKTVDPAQRPPESIRTFVTAFLLKSFTCTNRLPIYSVDQIGKEKKDPGIDVSPGSSEPTVKIPTVAWAASWSVSESFRPKFLEQLAKTMAPFNLMSPGQEGQSTISISNVSAPVFVKGADGKNYWEVIVNGNIVVTPRNQPQGVVFRYNKVVVVEASEPIDLAQLSQEVKSDDLVSIIHEARGSGLVITNFREYNPSGGGVQTK